MTAGAVDRCRGEGYVGHYGSTVVVIVAGEVGAVAGQAVPAIAGIDCGIAVAIDTNDSCTVDIGVASEAVVVMDSDDGVTGVAVYAKGAGGDGCGVVMAMGAGEVIGTVAADTFGIWSNGNDPWAIGRILQVWR